METPKSLLEASGLFSNPETAHAYLRDLRWPDGVIPCPVCKSEDHYYLPTQRRWKCKLCKKQFSVKVGTIFEDSPLGLDKWLLAVWLITNAKNGISSCELHRALEVTQKTAWFMLHRIRLAMQNGSLDKLCDEVEVDETYIGGKARNMHKHVRESKITGTGGKDKTVVMGMLEETAKSELRLSLDQRRRRFRRSFKSRSNRAPDCSLMRSDHTKGWTSTSSTR